MTKAKAKQKRRTGTAVAVHRPQPPAQPRSMIEVIAAAARDKTVDVGKMRELLAMQRELMAFQAEADFGVAMKSAKDEIPVVVKDSKNDETKSRYVKLETVSRVVDPIIRRHGFTLSYGMGDAKLPNHYRVTCKVRHTAHGANVSHAEDHFLDLPADNLGPKGAPNKTVVHGVASSVTYSRRILKCMIFDVNVVDKALPDDDGNAAGGDGAITQIDVERVIDACDDAGLDKARFCENFGIEGIAKLPAAKLREALDRIAQYKVNRKAAHPAAQPKQGQLV